MAIGCAGHFVLHHFRDNKCSKCNPIEQSLKRFLQRIQVQVQQQSPDMSTADESIQFERRHCVEPSDQFRFEQILCVADSHTVAIRHPHNDGTMHTWGRL